MSFQTLWGYLYKFLKITYSKKNIEQAKECWYYIIQSLDSESLKDFQKELKVMKFGINEMLKCISDLIDVMSMWEENNLNKIINTR
jgi:hypothetical protein